MKEIHEKTLNFIIAYMLGHDYPPTVREIAAGTGYASKATVFVHLMDMKKAGLIDFVGASPRTIRVPGYHYTYHPTEGREERGAGEGNSCSAASSNPVVSECNIQ